MSGRKEDNVQVVVRCRPLFGKELKEGRERIVDMDVAHGEVSLRNPKAPNDERKKFTFDRIFDWNCTQREVYEGAASGIVDASIQGFGGTISAMARPAPARRTPWRAWTSPRASAASSHTPSITCSTPSMVPPRA